MATTAKRGGSRKPRPAAMTPDEFRKLLEGAGLTTRQAGERLGTTSASVSRWQSGKSPIPLCIAILSRVVLRKRKK